ncbi:restriction endonuclease subunit S [Glaesserella parasuis]|nr:restriction endonuclease subunit S [Glaesserella parasuis]MDO9930566.1 restriction endonuclease subunit S [Glaesserella parasuis]MDO9981919.1 restriction endonuclease subunit S [Glaesserella parasuis]MDP0128046.1 restriction endonuclease subunit S [Glaesserella parasuis]MDP0173217.1 restriction endonuclease subunit S [Glaesserella parasuis]
MSSWKKSKLSEVINIIGGGTPKRSEEKYWNGNIPWLSVADFNNDLRFVSSSAEYITELGLSQSSTKLLKRGDLIISARGTVGCLAQLDKPMAFNQSCYGLNGKENIIDNGFLYYFLKNNIKELKQKTHGAVFDTITRDTFDYIEIYYPNIERQKEIAEILEDYDKKIQLNTQINQTLEQIAQTIFKSWFIDFDPVHAKANALASGQTLEQATQAAMAVISGKNTQELHRLQTANLEQYQQLWEIAEAFPSGFDEEGVPRGWEQTTLSEVCSMKNGYAFKSSDWTEEGIPVIKIGSVKPMIVEVDGNGFVDEEHSVLHSEFLLTEGDIVVGLTGYVGEVGRIPQGRTAMLNQRVAKFIPNKLNEQQDYYSFVYCLVRDKSFKAFAETNAKGSAQANISTKELLNYSIILASPEIQMKFESLIKPLLDKILVNSGNNEYLSKVRDLLLPNLLSGEIHL